MINFTWMGKLLRKDTASNKNYLPLKILLLETTTRCNLRCCHCNMPEPCDLSWENFEKILPILHEYKPSVQLNGHGETLLHPQFMKMLRAISNAGCSLQFQTNGMLLSKEIVDECIDLGVESILTSIDAADPELFARLRPPAQLETILANFRYIQEVKQKTGKKKPDIQFLFVAMRQNIHELPAVMRLAAGMDVAHLAVLELIEYDNTRQRISTRGESLVNDPLMYQVAVAAEKLAAELGLSISLPPRIPGREVGGVALRNIDPTNTSSFIGLRKACRQPWNFVHIKANGKVQPCCMIKSSYGNIFEQSFEEIWQSDQYQELRRKVLTDNPPEECLVCYTFGWEEIPK